MPKNPSYAEFQRLGVQDRQLQFQQAGAISRSVHISMAVLN